MKAIVWTKYGPPDVLQVAEVKKPVPGDDELLIRNYASTVTTGDCELRRFRPLNPFLIPMRLYIGLVRPQRIKILGQELAGKVEAVGQAVTRFKAGDQVYAATGFRLSAYAEYVCLHEDAMVALKPANLTYEEAAAVPLGGIEAWDYLNRVTIRPGQKVLINGAGGTIGTMAVQLARHFGAEVTAVDSAEKLAMLRSIGAEHVIDYAHEDFTKNGLTYDLIFDVIGSTSATESERSLKQDGRYLSANPGTLQQLRGLWNLIIRRREVMAEYRRRRNEALFALKELIEAGTIKPVIDRRYRLEEAAEAHRYVETGRKKGSVVLTVSSAAPPRGSARPRPAPAPPPRRPPGG